MSGILATFLRKACGTEGLPTSAPAGLNRNRFENESCFVLLLVFVIRVFNLGENLKRERHRREPMSSEVRDFGDRLIPAKSAQSTDSSARIQTGTLKKESASRECTAAQSANTRRKASMAAKSKAPKS